MNLILLILAVWVYMAFISSTNAQCASYDSYCVYYEGVDAPYSANVFGSFYYKGKHEGCKYFQNSYTGMYLYWQPEPSLGWLISSKVGAQQGDSGQYAYCNQQTSPNLDSCGKGYHDSFDYWCIRTSTSGNCDFDSKVIAAHKCIYYTRSPTTQFPTKPSPTRSPTIPSPTRSPTIPSYDCIKVSGAPHDINGDYVPNATSAGITAYKNGSYYLYYVYDSNDDQYWWTISDTKGSATWENGYCGGNMPDVLECANSGWQSYNTDIQMSECAQATSEANDSEFDPTILIIFFIFVISVSVMGYIYWKKRQQQQIHADNDDFGYNYVALNEFVDKDRSRNNNEVANCAICLAELEDDIKYLPCTHSFHRGCIDPWIRENRNCPICRTEVDQ